MRSNDDEHTCIAEGILIFLGTTSAELAETVSTSQSCSDPLPLMSTSIAPGPSESLREIPHAIQGINGTVPVPNTKPHIGTGESSSSSCSCLQVVGKMMTELEARSLEIDDSAVDSKLASQKDFLNRCNSILGCQTCSARPEYLLLLGLLTQNLTNFCEGTVNRYLNEIGNHPESSATMGPLAETKNRGRVGHYEVDSRHEWSTLMKVLIILQLQSVQTLLRGMKKASHLESNAILPRVEWPCPSERRIMALIQRLGETT